MHKRISFHLFIVPFYLFFCLQGFSQALPHPVRSIGVYGFLDELASQHIIDLNSVVKPYSRLLIAEKLSEANKVRDNLNARQSGELDFYLLDFGKELQKGKAWNRRKDLFYYSDEEFSITINPIAGGEIISNESGRATYLRNGAEARASYKNWGFQASLRDNHEKPLLGGPRYLSTREGGHIKDGTDWSEMRGALTYAWEWGNIGLVKDNFTWGSNNNGANIFGGNNPSFMRLALNLEPAEWFRFSYFHGFLNSMVVDSTRSYLVTNSYGTDYREVYHRKYIAANIFSLRPLPGLWVSFGNSIVYTDTGISPSYLMPLFFYKSIDHQLTSGIDNMNSQMFIDISSRQIKNLHLYGTLFIDEMSVSRFTMADEFNFFSWKLGGQISNIPVDNIFITTEFTYTYPLTYEHYVPTLTFQSNKYNLGHYLRDNSREIFLEVGYKPVRTLSVSLSYTDAVKGPDHTELGSPRLGNTPLESIEWRQTSYALRANYQIINDIYLWAAFVSGNTTGRADWTAPYFFGKKNTVNCGVAVGF